MNILLIRILQLQVRNIHATNCAITMEIRIVYVTVYLNLLKTHPWIDIKDLTCGKNPLFHSI